MQEILKFANEDVFIMIMGNKTDIEGKREVTYNQGLALAKEYNVPFIETSAKSGTNISDAFTMIANEIFKIQQEGAKKSKSKTEERQSTVIKITVDQKPLQCCG